MFAAVMSDEENCKEFLERALSIKVDYVEMQVLKQSALGRRSRYYQSQMDMEEKFMLLELLLKDERKEAWEAA